MPIKKIYIIAQGQKSSIYATALCEDGEVLASHSCSSKEFARLDMSLTPHSQWKVKAYKEHCPDGYELIDLVDLSGAELDKHEGFLAAFALNRVANALTEATASPKNRTYRIVAIENQLDQGTANRFVSYMEARWPEEEARHCAVGYADEWAMRFKGGREYAASDLGGQQLLLEIYRNQA